VKTILPFLADITSISGSGDIQRQGGKGSDDVPLRLSLRGIVSFRGFRFGLLDDKPRLARCLPVVPLEVWR
jgi:hypothetical protein